MANTLPLATQKMVVMHHLVVYQPPKEQEEISIILAVVGRKRLTHKQHFHLPTAMWTHSTTIIGFHKECSTRIHTLIKIGSDSSVDEGHRYYCLNWFASSL